MKIVFFATNSFAPWGGSEELWCQTAQLALKRGHQVAVVTFRWPEIPARIRELQEQGAWLLRVARLHDWRRARSIRWLLQCKFEKHRIWEALASWKPDVACISQGGTFDLVVERIFSRFVDEHGVPYILICQHNFEDRHLPTEADRETAITCFSRARRVAFVAERNLRVAERQIAAIVPGACVVRNPVNLASFDPVPFPDVDVVKMANVARLDAQIKGQDVILQVLSGENWKQRRWLLRFYGAGSDRPYLERLAGHYNIAEKVEFCGHVGDIRHLWADNHLLVMPSRSEGTPLSLVEAMICARPSVVTDVGGNREWVDESSTGTGFIAEAPSEWSLNNALERAWAARDRWESLGQRAHEVALSKIDPHPDETILSLLVGDRAQHSS